MLKVLADAYVAADSGHVTLLSLLDISAAFDTVDHSILMERLRRCRARVGLASVLLDRAIAVCPLQRRSLGNYACDVRRTSGKPPRTCVIPLIRGRRHQARRGVRSVRSCLRWRPSGLPTRQPGSIL